MKFLRNTKAISALTVVLVIIFTVFVLAAATYGLWNMTHYNINIGEIGIVTDQVGRVIRVDVGPTWWAEKSIWESVKYFDVKVRTIDMLSPSITSENGTTTMEDKPLEGLKYGAILASTNDKNNVFIDTSFQWHYDTTTDDWKEHIKALYIEYGGSDPTEITIVQSVRNSIYMYASRFNLYDLAYSYKEEFANTITPYVQEYMNNITTLHKTVIIDRVFIRRTIPPLAVQLANLEVKKAEAQAKAILTIANATRDASIQVAEGQSIAITMVVNATSSSVEKLTAQNITTTDAIRYLGLQYEFDQLKKIADSHPDWKLTIFINAPSLTFTIPVTSDQEASP